MLQSNPASTCRKNEPSETAIAGDSNEMEGKMAKFNQRRRREEESCSIGLTKLEEKSGVRVEKDLSGELQHRFLDVRAGNGTRLEERNLVAQGQQPAPLG